MAITLALAIFGINHRRLIMDRGWIPPDKAAPKLRLGEIRQLIESYAAYNSLSVDSCEKRDEDLMLKVKTQPRGIDQSEEFVLGGPGGARAYERPVRYEQALVAEIVLGLLQRAIPQTEGLERYRVDVTDETDNAVGELVITRAALERVGGPKAGSLSKDRALATSDTLGESRMWVRIEEPPRPYGARRRSALQIPTVSKRRF